MVAGRSRRTPKLAARLLSDSSHLSDQVVTTTSNARFSSNFLYGMRSCSGIGGGSSPASDCRGLPI